MPKLFFNEQTGEYTTTAGLTPAEAKKHAENALASGFRLVEENRSMFFKRWIVESYFCEDCKKWHLEYFTETDRRKAPRWFCHMCEMKKFLRSCKVNYRESWVDRHWVIMKILQSVNDSDLSMSSFKDKRAVLEALKRLRLKEMEEVLKSSDKLKTLEKKLVRVMAKAI
jgi:hypothetical protein